MLYIGSRVQHSMLFLQNFFFKNYIYHNLYYNLTKSVCRFVQCVSTGRLFSQHVSISLLSVIINAEVDAGCESCQTSASIATCKQTFLPL